MAFTYPEEKPNAEQTGGSADFVREHSTEFSSVAVMDDSTFAVNLSVNGGHAQEVNSQKVSEGGISAPWVCFLRLAVDSSRMKKGRKGHGQWCRSDGLCSCAVGRDPSIIGRAIRVNQETFTVVGVMPASFVVTAESAPGVIGKSRPVATDSIEPEGSGLRWR